MNNQYYLNNSNSLYMPPQYILYENSPTCDFLKFNNEAPTNFSNNRFANNNEYNKLSLKLIHLENRIASFSQFLVIVWILLILSLFSLISSISSLSYVRDLEFDYYRNYEIFNFFMCILHIVSYFCGIQAYNKQSKELNRKFEYSLICLIIIEVLYLIIYVVIYAYFISWTNDLIFLFMNMILYYQAVEITKILDEKETTKKQYELLYI